MKSHEFSPCIYNRNSKESLGTYEIRFKKNLKVIHIVLFIYLPIDLYFYLPFECIGTM